MIWAFATGAWASFAKLPRAFHIAFAVLLLCIAAFTLHRCAVSDAVEADRDAQAAKVATKVLSAERSANSADATRQTEIQANDNATREAIADATAKNPETSPAGPITRAAADSLRARSSRHSAPAR